MKTDHIQNMIINFVRGDARVMLQELTSFRSYVRIGIEPRNILVLEADVRTVVRHRAQVKTAGLEEFRIDDGGVTL